MLKTNQVYSTTNQTYSMARTTAIICNGANDILFGENIYNRHNLWQEQNSHTLT